MMTLRQFVKNADAVIQQHKMQAAMKLQKGQHQTMEAYNREVGRAEGMEIAIGLLRDMVQKIEDAATNDDLPEMPSEGDRE